MHVFCLVGSYTYILAVRKTGKMTRLFSFQSERKTIENKKTGAQHGRGRGGGRAPIYWFSPQMLKRAGAGQELQLGAGNIIWVSDMNNRNPIV